MRNSSRWRKDTHISIRKSRLRGQKFQQQTISMMSLRWPVVPLVRIFFIFFLNMSLIWNQLGLIYGYIWIMKGGASLLGVAFYPCKQIGYIIYMHLLIKLYHIWCNFQYIYLNLIRLGWVIYWSKIDNFKNIFFYFILYKKMFYIWNESTS